MSRPAWIGLPLCLALFLANGANLTAWAYAARAERQIDRHTENGPLAAARLAGSISPWSAGRLALAAWIQSRSGDVEGSEAGYRRALRWAPADPLIWTEYALALARAERFDALVHATMRARTLAPNSPAIRATIAAMGLNHWEQGSDELRRMWLDSMRMEIRRSRPQFLHTVMIRGRAAMFCAHLAEALHATRWCDDLRRKSAACEPGSGADLALCVSGR